MTTARTLVRFVFAGLFVNALAVACVVSDGDDDDDTVACDPGTYRDCTCANGDASMQKCSASGNGYGACACSDANVGGGGSGGEPSTTAGTSNDYGGEAGKGAGGAGGAGGDNSAGMMSEGGAAGAGGAAPMCERDPEPCQDCIQTKCCAEWTACSADPGDCEQQFFNILIGCAQVEREDRDIINADLELCALEVENGDVWSEGLLPTTKALIDCIGGGEGWENRDMWNAQSCKDGCFAQEVH